MVRDRSLVSFICICEELLPALDVCRNREWQRSQLQWNMTGAYPHYHRTFVFRAAESWVQVPYLAYLFRTFFLPSILSSFSRDGEIVLKIQHSSPWRCHLHLRAIWSYFKTLSLTLQGLPFCLASDILKNTLSLFFSLLIQSKVFQVISIPL